MKVISESYLRDLFRKEVPKTFRVEAGQILTPSASQLLSERGVEILRGDARPEPAAAAKAPEEKAAVVAKEAPKAPPKPKYVSAMDGGLHVSKPEHMTQLYGNRLVYKDSDRIVFRGKLDSFQADLLEFQGRVMEAGNEALCKDLENVMDRSRDIMRCDALNEPLEDETILGLTDPELRERSHRPKKYFGMGHLIPTFDLGWMILGLNRLRSTVREVEVSAVRAFRNDLELERADILQALNRMSSAIYIMMLKEKSGQYR